MPGRNKGLPNWWQKMIGFNKTTIISAVLYAVIVLISLFVGSSNEDAAYLLFLSSSVLFSATIVYGVWKESKPLRAITYPTEDADASKNQLSSAIQKVLFEKVPPTYFISRLRQILIKKLSLRLDLTEDEAEKLLQNPEKLRDLGYDKLAFLISKDNFLTKTRDEKIKLLNTILTKLEED
jgi:hypothetical protein